jgi:hypothetical protein
MKFQNKLCPWTIVQILIHTWKFTIGSSASCYTHWFKCQCSPPSYLCTLNVWHEQGHCGVKRTSYSWVTTKGTCHTCWKGLVGHKFCCMIKPICGIRSIKQMIKKTTRISNPFAEHQIYITGCRQILRHSSSAFWRCGNGFCTIYRDSWMNSFFLFFSQLAE